LTILSSLIFPPSFSFPCALRSAVRDWQEVQNAVILIIQLNYRRERRLLGAGARENYMKAVAITVT
jgi:hypothetical protein